MLDILAKRYGGLPTDYMKLSVRELSENLRVALIGIQRESELQQEIAERQEAAAKLDKVANSQPYR